VFFSVFLTHKLKSKGRRQWLFSSKLLLKPVPVRKAQRQMPLRPIFFSSCVDAASEKNKKEEKNLDYEHSE
jgi:hypothetical protein